MQHEGRRSPLTEEKSMFNNPEQFANATKTLFDLQMQTFNALASKAVQGVEQWWR
ncbi:conserved hypothetical protein [Ricinus communis]|uniref:Uncharacterized protein n=1 Tax=Ricinus communis TaxID=3988 RepID=B9TCE5_RICCO|nr:conserved hypothetical protein [Ricinus communis]